MYLIGEPPAHEVVWKIAGRQLDEAPGNGIKIDNSKQYKSILIKEGLTRKDGGALVCTATNMEGNASNQLGKIKKDALKMYDKFTKNLILCPF